MARFDAIVIGAGPAGSVAAHGLAAGGASVLLLDRARFPRDKPCGGGVTVRAARVLPYSLAAVVEDVVDTVELGLRFTRRYERVRGSTLALMTRRTRLDALLAGRAAAVGADFRDGVRATGVTAGEDGVVVRAGREAFHANAVIAADGANGVVRRELALATGPIHGVALEGAVPFGEVDRERYRGRVVFELGLVPGGYGWVFPKADHVNVGVGGWEREGPRLRAHLARLCDRHGIPPGSVRGLRGHRLPVARPGALLARGRAAVVGDAAGLVDPLAGDGIYAAFTSGALAAGAVLDLLAGRARDLAPYAARLGAALHRELALAWAAKVGVERVPLLMFTLARAERVQQGLERLVRGDPAPVGPGPLSRLLHAGTRAVATAGHARAAGV